MNQLEALDLLEGHTISYQSTTDKEYDNLAQYGNVTSYSMLNELHSCPRKFQKLKQRAARKQDQFTEPLANIDFAFGHSVGAGVQNWFLTGNFESAILNSMLAWKADFDDRDKRKKKSIWEASIAVQKFIEKVKEEGLEWRLANKDGVEYTVGVHSQGGFKHYIHMDLLLKNDWSGDVAVGEIKTTGMNQAEEAVYLNSNQALSYSIPLDYLHPDKKNYEVIYFVYSSTSREWEFIPFPKTIAAKAEYLKSLMLDHAMIAKYEELGFYPKHGESCYAYSRRCQFYGECDMVGDEKLPIFDSEDDHAEKVNLSVRIEELVASLKGKAK